MYKGDVQRKILHTKQTVISLGAYNNVPFIIYLFHNFSNSLNLKTADLLDRTLG